MQMPIVLSLLVLMQGLAGTEAWATVYYVAKIGASDANPGTKELPWATIQKATTSAMVRGGDTVLIKSGTYHENITILKSGQNGKPITFKNYPGDTVIVEPASSGWWGVFTIQGRSHLRLEGLEIRGNAVGWGVLVEHAAHNPGIPSNNIELVGLHVHHTGGEAIQIRGNAHDILIEDCLVHDGTAGASGIDIYQWPDARGRPHHVTVRGCTAHNFRRYGGIASEQTDSLLIENNEVHSNELGLDIGSGKSNTLRNNTIYDCVNAIAVSSNHNSQIYGNTITNISEEAFYNYYFADHGEPHTGNKYYNNVIKNAGGGIYESNTKTQAASSYGPTSGHVYYNNVFFNVSGAITSRPPFYFKGTTGLKFFNNTVVIAANFTALGLTNGATSADIRNNIFSIGGNRQVLTIDRSSSAGNMTDFNCYFNRMATLSGALGTHSVSGDPRFVDAISGDLQLQADSPCIDRASSTGLVPLVDLRMLGRCDNPSRANGGDGPYPYLDMGAYEHACGTAGAASASLPTNR